MFPTFEVNAKALIFYFYKSVQYLEAPATNSLAAGGLPINHQR